jgi:hypothetical protein
MDEPVANKDALALTVKDLLDVVKQEHLGRDAKIFLSSDEEGNSLYGLAEFGLEDGYLVLYPRNNEKYALFDD